MPDADLNAVAVVFTDIDDTLTTDGRLSSAVYSALWALHEAGFELVPVTGRSAGWCDMIARQWPVSAAIGENGALAFRHNRETGKMETFWRFDAATRAQMRAQLQAIQAQVLKSVPSAGLASDQAFRIHDLAIDIGEDRPPIPEADVAKVLAIFQAAGATAKKSSVQVNGWIGDFDKLGMVQRLALELFGCDLRDPEAAKRAIYIGDSPNDASCFAAFSNAVGVQNLRRYEAEMPAFPAYITEGEGGAGFLELAARLLKAAKGTAKTCELRPHGRL